MNSASKNLVEEKKKRERAVNFTELEVRFLVDIVIRHINIIENKQTDAVTWREKNKAWENVATEFNAVTGSVNRNPKVLRTKYEGIKRIIKQKQSKNKLEILKTGGGSSVTQPLTDYEDKLLGYISVSVEGLPSENDSDYILSETVASCSSNATNTLNMFDILPLEAAAVEDNNDQPNAEETSLPATQQDNVIQDCIESNCSPKWKTWNPKLLRKKKHAALQITSTQRKQVNKESLNKSSRLFYK